MKSKKYAYNCKTHDNYIRTVLSYNSNLLFFIQLNPERDIGLFLFFLTS